MNLSPTSETYTTLNKAYEFFNRELFENKLPTCLITMQRKSKARGYFCPERFESRGDNTHHIHEIALNPTHFLARTDEDIISTLVHEMAHLWQQEFGHPSRGNYHNSEWADKMDEIGLIASNTGEEGGKRTGQAMTHYIDPEGRYARLVPAFMELVKPLAYQDRQFASAAKKAKNKIKYTCPQCRLNAWGKPGANLLCGDDRVKMVTAEGS